MSIFQPFSTPPHDYDHHRNLYDEAFLDSGCNPTIFEEGGLEATRLDNTVGTWSTNYAILAVCLVGAFKFSCMMEPVNKRWLFSSLYFFFSGLGFGLAGVNHQTQNLKSDPNFYWVAFILTTLGALSLQYQISANYLMAANSNVMLGYIYTVLVSVLGLAAIVSLVLLEVGSTVAGGYLFGSNIWFILYFGYVRDCMANLGSIVAVAGMVIQYLWGETCGKEAYDECFQDCILPNPRVFNHNGVYHVVLIVAFLIHLFARFVPRELTSDNNDVDEEEEEDNKATDNAGREVQPNDPVSSATA